MSDKLTMNQKLQAVYNRLQQRNLFRQVSEFFNTADTKHNTAWNSYGYKNELGFEDFYTMYNRFGIAHAVVDMPVDKCWQDHPCIVEDKDEHDQTAWEKEFEVFCKRHRLWHRLKGLDWRQRLSRYAGLIMFVRDGKEMSEPLEGRFKPDDLADIRPVVEFQLYPTVWDEDPTSIRYGQPIMYQFNEQELGDSNQHSGRSVQIHHTRVIVWAEGADDGTIYGRSALEPVFNSLVTLEKLIGAGGEGFWKNARAPMTLDINQDADLNSLAQMLGTGIEGLPDALNEQVEGFQRDMDQMLALQGIEAKPLQVDLAQPKEFFEIALNDVAAGGNPSIPATILTGQQTGRLASDEDQSQWAQVNESRRENWLDMAIEDTIRRFMQLGFVKPLAEFYIEWPSLQEPSPKDKLERAKMMATTNKELAGTGLGIAFEVDEIRAMAGDYDPLEGEDLSEGEIDVE